MKETKEPRFYLSIPDAQRLATRDINEGRAFILDPDVSTLLRNSELIASNLTYLGYYLNHEEIPYHCLDFLTQQIKLYALVGDTFTAKPGHSRVSVINEDQFKRHYQKALIQRAK